MCCRLESTVVYLYDCVMGIPSVWLERLKESGLPQTIKVDNGSEFISKALDKWAYDNQVTLDFSRPGKPTDNPFIESFNGSFRDECLNVNWFLSLEDAKEKIQLFKEEYNGFRPHSSLSGLTPNEVVQQHSNGPIFSILGRWRNWEELKKREIS